MSSNYYSSDDDIDIHVRRRSSPMQYVEPRRRPQSYYPQGPAPSYLFPERTVITTRSRSRDRSRERLSSPPSAAPPAPVIINNRIYKDYSSDEDDDRHLQLVRPHRHSHSRSASSSHMMTREEYEMERARQELENLRVAREHEDKERRHAKELREEAELKRAKQELEEIKRREAQELEEKRIKRELELERLREEEREEAEKKRREKEAEQAVERYKRKELERMQKEQEEKEAQEKEYQRRLQEDLIKSGLDEKQIAAILKKERVADPREEKSDGPRPTYTRMARRHLSVETLRTFRIEYELDSDPEFVLIKRWVPEWEQDTLWKHTKYLREKRSKLLLSIDDKKHHHHHHHREPEFEWVRKKSDRKRSKSPALLMYLAGAKPA